MKRIYFFLTLIIAVQLATAQNSDCKVLLDSLKGTYEGGCKNGKADGNGKAVGVNSYDGEFKNGLPEGKGKYTWANGDYYYGSWKKGLKDGKGELHRFENGKEMLVKGYWKKDNYKGEYENPYVVHNLTSDINRVQVTKVSDKDRTLTVTVENLVGGATSLYSAGSSVTTMTAHQVTRGSYVSKSSNALSNKEVTTFRGIIFPFRVTLNFGNSTVEIEIFEEGGWDLNVPINK